ncbi:MAG: hypothetical protein KAH07_09975, partial [Flavobacteriaceae bacterium]|nr:hypothetical protein [Flavobacteriaceae bacterium]
AERSGMENLLIDPNFTFFDPDNVTFDTEYNQRTDFDLSATGMYAVTQDAQLWQSSFYGFDSGYDDTVGPRNFMIVNGWGTGDFPNVIWSQNVYIAPNTNYKFGAHIANLRDENNMRFGYRFKDADGNIAYDHEFSPGNKISNEMNNYDAPKNDTECVPSRFLQDSNTVNAGLLDGIYTFEILSYREEDLGNDFGIDGVFFGPLGKQLYRTSPSGTNQACKGFEIDEITYLAVGQGTAFPTVTGLPAGVTYSYKGQTVTILGAPTEAGDFTYTVTSLSSCGDLTKTGIITVSDNAVDAGPDIETCSNIATVTMDATFGANVTGIWSGGTGTFTDETTSTAEYTLGAGEVSGTVTLTYTSDAVGGCGIISDTVDLIITEINAEAGDVPIVSTLDCSDTTVALSADPLSGGYTGEWTVLIGQTSKYNFSDVTSPTSNFTGSSGALYTLVWTVTSPAPGACTEYDTLVFAFAPCLGVSFDGLDDVVDFKDNFDVSADFSFEMWIKPDVIEGLTKTIFSKKDINDLSTGQS